jgi:hypothetical protein
MKRCRFIPFAMFMLAGSKKVCPPKHGNCSNDATLGDATN